MSIRRVFAAAWLLCVGTLMSGCCGISSCGPCGSSCGSGLPTQLTGRMVNRIANPCSQGCGEVYWDEQINHPPVCDPCGGCGEFTGVSCGECKPLLSRLRQAWGMPYVGPCECADAGCDAGCDSCGASMYGGESSMAMHGSSHHAGGGHHCASCAAGGTPPIEHYPHQIETMPAQPVPAEVVPAQPTPAQQPSASSMRRRQGQPTVARPYPTATRSTITR